jgi:hypothetical protein
MDDLEFQKLLELTRRRTTDIQVVELLDEVQLRFCRQVVAARGGVMPEPVPAAKPDEKRKAYMREYMRKQREKQKAE